LEEKWVYGILGGRGGVLTKYHVIVTDSFSSGRKGNRPWIKTLIIGPEVREGKGPLIKGRARLEEKLT